MQLLLAAALIAISIGSSAAAGLRRSGLRADVESYAMVACLTRQDVPFLREQGHLRGNVVLRRRHGPLKDWTTLADAVGAAAARRSMPMARGDGAVHDPLKPMPLLFCHELVHSSSVRLAPAYR